MLDFAYIVSQEANPHSLVVYIEINLDALFQFWQHFLTHIPVTELRNTVHFLKKHIDGSVSTL